MVNVRGVLMIPVDPAVLDLLGIPLDAELEVSTDGKRLILSSLRNVPEERQADPTEDPKRTLIVLDELKNRHDLTPELFRQIHHFGPRASLESHRKYCEGTKTFRSQTNIIVSRRLAECLRRLDAGEDWATAIKAVRKHHPFPEKSSD
jgi:hypothetical protein